MNRSTARSLPYLGEPVLLQQEAKAEANGSCGAFSRRDFLITLIRSAGALSIGFAAHDEAHSLPVSESRSEITAWIVLEPDNSIVVRIVRSEMGQGILTAFAMLVAEELECDWSKVKTEYIRPDQNLRRNRVWGDMSTGASRSVRESERALRTAGASAREALIAAAATHWRVPHSECHARNSFVIHQPSGHALSFAQIAALAAELEFPTQVRLKDPKEWRLAGTAQPRIDALDKVKGTAVYGIDVRLPGMVYAAVLQCPVFTGRIEKVDATKAFAIRRVHTVVQLESAIAVVAEDWWTAQRALQLVDVVWQSTENSTVTTAQILHSLREGFTRPDAGVGRQEGDFETGFSTAETRIEVEYQVPFVAHATLEPQNATAWIHDDQVEVWAPTQNAEASLVTAARAAGVPVTNVVVHKTAIGGGFGRRGFPQDFVSLAVQIAKRVASPVKVLWSREEDMRHDYYRPMVAARMRAGLDPHGRPSACHVRLSGPSFLTSIASGRVDKHFQQGFVDDLPYEIANYVVDHAPRRTHVPIGPWRCVHYNQNCFFRESFVDELAHAAREDPYHYRLKLLPTTSRGQRLRGVLTAVAERAQWGTPPRHGLHHGIAVCDVNGTYVATVVEASVVDELRVHRVITAIDCGTVVNPLTVQHQVESGTVWALTAALYGSITIRDGAAAESNFDSYPMLRLRTTPEIDTIIVPGGDGFSGVGEPPVAAVAPALCNAIFSATGQRIRSLPMNLHLPTKS
jgi:isoquinoline 1-oxidoreductase beta subunit